MKRSYMLDTDTCSFAIRGGNATLRDAIKRNADALCVSAVTAGELRYGALKKGSRRITEAVETFLSLLHAVPWDGAAAGHYADIRCFLESAGTPIGHADMMIAASARAAGCVVVTHNTAHFSRVPRLKVEDWC